MKHVRAFSVVMVVAMVLVGQAIMAESVQAWWTGAVGPLSNHHGEMTRDALKEGLGWSDTEIGTIPEKSDKYADDTSPYKHGTGCTHRVKKYQDIFNQKSTTDDCYDLGAEFCAAKFLGNAKYFYSVGDTANGEKYLGLAIHFIEDSLCPAHVFPMKQGLALTASHTWCEMNTHNDYATYWSPTVRSYAPISINNPVQLEDRLVTEADYVYSLRCGYFEEGSDQGMIYPNGVVDNPRYETWEMSDSDLNSIFQKIGGLVQGAAIWATTIKTLGDAVDNTGLSWTASSNGEANWFGQTATSYYGGDAAQSGDITHGYSTWLQTTVNESGTLTFYWKVSSEATYDYLVFYVDWIEMARISGSVDWQQKSYTISPGTHTLQWRYVKNGSGDGGSDCGWVDKVEFTPDAPGALGEALDNTSLTWTTGGSPTEWFPQTTTSYYGGDAAQSGDIPDDRYTWLQTTVSESGTLTFYWKVSSEATNDYLVFYVDWIEMARISGSVDWQQKSYTISPGTHTLQWRYVKNGSGDGGSDCGWVDKVEFTPDAPGALGEALDNTSLTWTTGGSPTEWFPQTTTSYYGGDAAQSGDIPDDRYTWLQTTVSESGTLTFYWKVSSEATNDYLVFYVDWIEMARISGSVDWQQKSYTISPGTHTLQWRYIKNGSISNGSDCGWVDKVEFTPDTPGALGEAVDNMALTWITGGSPTEWFAQTVVSYYGGDAAQSGDIPDDRYTWLQTTVSESGTLTFYWKVSSEATNDYLVFYVDWIEMARISGSVDWQQKSYTISPGTHTLQWRYIKNGSISNGSDCGWVDKVEFPSPSTTEVGIYPPSQEVTRGESFSVNVAVDPKVAIAGVQFDLSFDSSLITAVSVEEGNLLNQNGANTYFSAGTIDNGLGTITGVACSITKAGGTVSSPGVFAIINFTAKDAQGTSPLDLSNVMVGDINGDPVPIAVGGGNVTIGRTGDVNNDDHVDVLDMILIGQHWEETGSSGWIPEDVKKDGVINVLDMIIIGQHWTG